MAVSLFTVRVILNVLGVIDYGIYNVVAGVVSMLGFLNGAMATASQRFFSYELGREDTEALRRTFSMSLNIYLLIMIAIVILAETIGLWLVKTKLVIPDERITAARIIYQFSIVSFLASMLSAPYLAVIIARENMDVYAYVSIFEVLFKLISAFLIKYLAYDKLILYGLLLMISSFLSLSLYILVCRRRYKESRYQFFWDRSMFRILASYTGWNLFGSAVGVVKIQAINILLNMFFGPVVNTARTIATQVSTAVNSFSQNFSTAVRPQIIKHYAAGNKDQMLKLVFQSSKLTFFLMYFISFPLILEMPFVMKVWLKQIPGDAILYTRLVLVDIMIDSISYPLMTAAQATGEIKVYQAVVGGFLLLNLPCSYIALELGAPAQSVLVIAIVITTLAFIIRLIIVRRLLDFPINPFIQQLIKPLMIACIISAPLPLAINLAMHESIVRFFLVIVVSMFTIGLSFYFLALQRDEQIILNDIVHKKLAKLKST